MSPVGSTTCSEICCSLSDNDADSLHVDENEVPYRLLYLEADEHTLINRFKETRRRHPPDSSSTARSPDRSRAGTGPRSW